MQALALEPELRFSRAEEFSRALLQYQQTKSLEKTRKEKQRRKWISLLSVFLVLAIVGGTVGYLWLSRAAKAKNVQPAATNSRLHQRNAFCPRSSSPGSA